MHNMQAIGQTRASTLLVILVTLVALASGWLVKTQTENRTRTITQAGIALDVPPSWLVLPSAENALFAATDLRRPAQRGSVTTQPHVKGASLADVATMRIINQGRNANSFRVLEQGVADLDGTPAYSVHFARVIAEPNTMPRIIEGIEYYIVDGDRVVIVQFEDESDSFAASLPAFERMAATLRVVESGDE
jgi:hypothetical protein